MDEMRKAFEKVKMGKEKELQDVTLVFFERKSKLLEKLKEMTQRFEKYKEETAKEIDLKDKIIEREQL